jgi:hypothetical protein
MRGRGLGAREATEKLAELGGKLKKRGEMFRRRESAHECEAKMLSHKLK